MAGLTLLASPAHAIVVDWRTEAANGNWDGGTGCGEVGGGTSHWWYGAWAPNQARGRPDCFGNHQLLFNNNDDTTMTLNGASWYNANTITFGASATTARTMNGANGLDLRDTGAGITNNSSATHVWNISIAFNVNPVTFNVISGDMTFNSNLFFKANWLDVRGSSGKTLNLFGVLNRDGGDGGLAVKDNTLAIITNNNNITGNMWAEKGVIRFAGNTNAMGNGVSVNVGTNASVELDYSAGEVLRTNAWNLYGVGTNGLGAIKKISTSGNVTIGGTVTIQQDTAIRSDGGSLILSNTVSGTPVLSKVGTGTLQLSSNNTYSGKTHISNGVVVITQTNGLGTAAGDTTVIGGAALEVRGVSSYEPLVINGHGLNGNGAVYNDLTTAGATLTNIISINSDSAIGGTGQLTLSGVISGSAQLTKVGTGTNILSGNNTFSGVTIVSNGILRLSHTNGLGTTAGGTFVRSGAGLEIQVSGGMPAEIITIAGSGVTNGGALRIAATTTMRGNINLDADATIGVSGSTTIDSGVILNLSNRTLTVDNSVGVTMNSGSSISNATLTTGSGAFVKNGVGFFLLRPSSDMTGSMTVNGGELRIGPNASGSGLVAGGTLTLNGGSRLSSDSSTGRSIAKNVVIGGNIGLAENGGGNLVFSGTVDLGTSVRIITNSGSVGFTAAISGTGGGITKRGSGTWTNAGSSTYTGATTIEAGTLVMSGSAASSAVTIESGGTMRGNSGTGVGALTINGLVDPGGGTGTNQISSILSSTLTLGQNGTMIFDISNVSGTPGSQWDRLLVGSGGGSITVAATSGNKFTVRVTGNPTGWDNTLSYSWLFVDGGSVSSFASDRFNVVVDGSFPSLGGGTFAVTNSGGELYLAFTPSGGPDIEARGNGVAILDGDTTPSLADHTDFGDILTTGGTLTRTYTFTNAGSVAVGLGNISFTGGNPGDFTVINQLPATLAAGGSTNIQIEFNPSADGTRSTTLEFTNTVTAKSPYSFIIQGTGVTYNLDVLGNSTVIADGDATPTTADHTDFGSVGVNIGTLVRTYTINNTGNREIGIGNVSVGGTHAADYTVTTQPAVSIAAGGSTTFQVTFDPSTTGIRSANLSFTNTSSTGKSPYNFDIQGTGAGSGISNSPTSLSFSSVLGSTPAAQTFGITNVGLGSMTYSLTTNASWLIVSNVSGTAAAGAGNIHTASVQLVSGIAPGTSNATITITGDAATTNSPKTISVSWTISAVPNPSAVAAQGEGSEFVRLLWTKDPSYDVLIVHRATNAPGAPVNNTLYNQNDTIGSDGSRVIYKGSAAYFEHVVAPGTTNHYAFYSVNNNYYSSGLTAAATNRGFTSGVSIETFSYTNGLTMSSRNGGTNWTASWTANSGTFTVDTNKFTVISGFAASGNVITGNNASIRRDFTAVTSGRIYAMFMLRTDNGGGSQYSGFSFFDNATEEKFIGEGFSQVNQLTVGANAGRQLANNTDYTVIVRYDFGSDVFSAVLYTNASESVPAVEPGTWHVTETDASVTSINRIRLESNVGTRWDEVRVATNYYELLGIAPPGAGLAAGPTNLSVSVMKGSTATATFSVTNVGGADLLYTNYITYGSGSGWLSVAPSSATVIGGDTRINTGTVSAVGLAAGSFVATNRVDGNETNSAAFIVFDVTVTNIPALAAAAATNDGAEMVRLTMTGSGLDVLVVHRAGAAPSADPTDNTLYNVGSSIGSGTVVFKGAAASFEHVVGSGTTNFYRFYSINNNHYSPSLERVATTTVYRAGEILEQFAYTNNVNLSGRSGGQGWTNAWSVSAPNTAVDTVVVNSDFGAYQPLYPAERANRFVLRTTNSSTYTATRNFEAVTTGTVYVAVMYRRQFDEGGADGKFSGVRLLNGGVEQAFVGERGGANDDVFGISSVAGATHGGANSFMNAQDFLLIGRYNFETDVFSGHFYTNSQAIPGTEPAFFVSVTNSTITRLDGITLVAGATSGWNGEVHFDELRVARSWAELLNLTRPSATNYVINGGNNVTDGQIVSGSFTVVYDFYDSAGMTNSASSPNFDLWTAGGTRILTNQPFATAAYSDGGRSLKASNATHAGASTDAVVLGTYTSRWTAANSNGVTVSASDSLSNGTVTVFTVVDDDTTGPVHSGFTGMGRTLAGATYTNTELGSGLMVTGLVTDAQSGVYAGTSNRWTLFRGGATVNNGSFTAVFSDGSAVSSNGQLTATLASGDVSASGSYTLRVFSVNYDIDRAGDSESTSNDYQFTVLAAAQDADVYGNGLLIPDNDTTPTLADHTDFGDVLVAGGTLTRTYTITNSGSDVIGIGTITTNAGGNPTNFIVTVQPAASLAIGAITTFQVQFNPSAAGTAFADIQFTNTVGGAKNPYSFRVQGTGTYVEIAVTVSGASIADGDATPSTADGTDFGNVGVSGSTSNITYTITNSGNRAMSLGNVTTSGTHAADFIVTAQPAATLNPSNTTTFTVQFNPSAVGVRSAALSFTTTDDATEDALTENPFNFSIQGTGAGSGISNFPTTLSFSSALGSLPSPSFQAFAVTNVGLGSMTYTLATNVNWLRLSNNIFTAAAGAGNVHTAHVQLVSGLAVGTSNATITITGDSATTNSPKTISVTWTITAITDPTAQTATADGAELVRLAWTKNPSFDVMIVYDTAAISTEPTQGTAYSVGATLGTGRVIYKGAAAAFEHVVAAGSSAHYKFYSVNNDYYSAGVSANVTLNNYLAGEIVEPFAYTNNVGTQGLNGGQGFSGAWTLQVPRTNTDAVVDSVNFATFQSSWPAERGNRMVFRTTNSASYEMSRTIPTINCGQVYVAALMRREFNEGPADAKYQLLRFLDGTNVVGSVGDRGSGDDQFGVRAGATAVLHGGAESFPAATDYLVIGRYDFSNGVMAGIFYTSGQSVPSNEPAFFVSSTGLSAQITGVGLAVGAGSGWVGEAHFDELRVARNWGDLLNLLSPKVTNYVVDGDNIVTDAQMINGTYEVRVDLNSAAGVDTDGTPIATTFDLVNPSGTAVVNNDTFGHFTYTSPSSVTATDINHAVTSANNALGVYTVRVTAVSSNGGQIVDNRFVGNTCTGSVMTFTVTDDDTAAPVLGASGDWSVVYNLPDQQPTFGTTSTNEYAIRQLFVDRITALGSGNTAYLATFTFSASSACCGGAGPIIDALTTALDAGAVISMVVDKLVDTNLVSTGSSTNSLGSLARRGTNPLTLVQDDSASGIMHHKLGLFDYGSGNKRVIVASWNMTGAASSEQWNIALDARSDSLYSVYLSEFTELLAGRFHDDPAKSHAHDKTPFTLGGSWGQNYVRFAPFTNSAAGQDNALRDITNFIHSATGQIVFALNKMTRMAIASQLVARCDAGVKVDGVMPKSDTDPGGDSAAVYSFLTNSANYATTNRVRFYTAYAKADYSATDAGESDLVHTKYMVIDPLSASPVVIHGSANWTFSALQDTNQNDENLLFLRHAGIASRFLQNFQRITGALTNLVSSAQDEAVVVFVGTNAVTKTGTGTNSTYSVTDAQLASVASTNKLVFSFSIYDPASGLSRDPNPASSATNTRITVVNLTTNNVTNLNLSASSSDTTVSTSSSVWEFVSVPAGLIDAMVSGVSNLINATIVDGDTDRSGDASTNVNQQFGFFHVRDDDTNAPTFGVFIGQGRSLGGATYTNNEFSGGFWVTGTVTDAISGLYAASNTFTLSRDGSVVSSGVFAVNFADGGATGGGLVSNNFPIALMSAGSYTLTVFAVDYDIDRSGDALRSTNVFSFTVVEPPAAPGLAVGPLTLSYTAMLGSNPDVLSTFTVTNVGSAGTLIYTNFQTYGTGATGWFAANPTNNSLAITATRIHTGHVASTTFTATGTYTATNRVAGNQTNAAQEIVVTLVVTAIPPPTVVSATPSGAEFVRVDVTEPSGRQILIVSRQTNAPSADPTQGTAYNLGDTLGGGRVVYKGAASFFEQVVQPGSTNFYNVYTINNDRYSSVTTVGATTTVYGAGVIVEPFSYTNNSSLASRSGGTGWTNAWTVSSGGYGMSTSVFSAITGYPADAGNVVTGTSSSAYREFAEYTSGKVYVSYKFRISNGSGYAGLSFFNNGTEQIFFGERGGAGNDNVFAVDGGAGNVANGGQLANDTDYTLIGMYDFDTDTARALIYTNAINSIPSTEPVSWHAQITDADPTRINRIRIESGSGTIVTKWDEIRVATTWDALIAAAPTYIWDAGGGPGSRDWSTAVNWTADTEPTATNNAFIGNSYTGVVSVAGEVAANLFIGQGTTGTVLQTGGTLGVNNLFLGYSNTAVGVYTISGGSVTVATDMVVGAAGAGTATVHGAGTLVSIGSSLQIGLSNANNRAVFNHNAGTVTAASVYIGRNSATEGRYTMTGGVLTVSTDIFLADGNANSTGRLDVSGGRIDVANIFVGRNGLGLMSISGAATVNVIGANSDIVIGDLASNNRSNRLTISGGTVNVGDNIELGDAANTFGSMLMSGGTMTVTGLVAVGDVAGSTGQVSVTGGNVQIVENLSIGNAGLGQLEVHGGSVTANIIRVSDESGGAGSTLLVGGGRLVAAGTTDFEIDFTGTATVTGGVLEAHDIDLGTQAGALATLNVGGSGTVIANNPFVVGFASGATGVVNQTGGTLDLVSGTASFNIGATAGSFGFYTVTGGVITTDHNLLLGSSDGTGTGVFHVVGSAPSITIGDGTTEDFTMQSAAAELRVTFVNSALAPILVQDDITVAGTLTISNAGPWAAGTYTVVTSLNSSAVIGTFSSINWLGGVTGTVTYSDRAVRITVDGNIPNPTNQTATADGKEMVRLAWTQVGGYTNVMIVHRAGAAVSGDPVQGTPYSVGASLGGGTVIYRGTGTALEHIVGQGTTHHYEFFSYTGNFYSTGVTANATTEIYDSGEHVEQFAYTNDVPVSGLSGGQGWSNAWSSSAPNAPVDVVIGSGNFAAFQPQWPDEKANRIVLKTTNSSTYVATRSFAPYNSGKVYVAALYRREFGEGADGKFSGIRLLSEGVEQAFFGERGGAANEDIFGVSTTPGTPTSSTYGSVNSFHSVTNYLIIGRYDFDTDVFSAMYYTPEQSVPSIEPSFFASATNASITSINGISLVSGADSGWNGQVHFDELRVASSWADLLRLTGGPYATNYAIGVTNYVSDGEIRSGSYSMRLNLRSAAGIETVSTTPPYFVPNADLFNPNGVQIVTDRVFTAFAYSDAGQAVLVSNSSQPTVEFGATVLGVHTGRWSAISSNGISTINSGSLSNGTLITFTVYDDDVDAPTTMNINSPESGASRSMHVSSNSVQVGSVGGTSGTNITYRLTDHYLANHLSNATPLVFYFGGRDAGSGLSRGTNDASTQSSLSIGSAVVSNVFNWDTTRSSAFLDTDDTASTSAWSWVGAFLPNEIDNLVTNTASGVMGSNRVTVTWRDADNDRASDRSTLFDSQHGWLVVDDDDTAPPLITNFAIRGASGINTATVAELLSGLGWAITGRVVDGVSQGGSGINVNGTNTVQPNISPYFELWDSDGNLMLRQAFNGIPFANGGATTLSQIGSSNNTAVASAPLGTWTARVIVADADLDRPSDRAIATNEFAFEVVVGDSQTSMQVSPTVLNITSSFGVVSGGGTWPNFYVTNNGIGALIYSATISYSGGGSGWLTVQPNSGVSINTGGSQIHTSSVNVASLNPGTYQAVVALAGNQTNGTRYVTNNLTVFGYFAGEIVDPFTNTAGTALNGLAGGTGWTNAWNASTFTLTMTNLAVPNNYPAAVSNKICGSTASEITARRYFPSVSTGKLFAAVAMRKDASDNNGYAGISFMEGATERAFAGKIFGSQWLGIEFGGSSTESGFGIYQSTYLVVLYYDFDNDVIRTRAFNPGDTLSLTEPGTWSLTRSNAAITSIDGIRLAGSGVGNLCFDEVRVARTWENLLNQFTSEPTLHASGLTFNNVTTNSMTVGWTPGNGNARIVIAREGQAVTFSPIDGSNYNANADFLLGTDLGGGQKVIYNNSGSSVDFTSLTSNTQYFFRVFEYSATGINYLTNGTPLNGSRWTLIGENSEQITNFVAISGSDTTITNLWTQPGGSIPPDGYVIFRRNGSPVEDYPVDGVGYTNNQIVNNARVAVVGSGTITNFLQTNLTSCATYHFTIYPYRRNAASAETINYLTNNALSASDSTTCVEPTQQASNIVFSAIGTNTITLNWQNGDGTRRMVLVRATNAVSQHPVDGQTYTPSTTFGSGSHLGDGNYVVYRDTGSTVTVIGLAPGVTYHFRVYEFTGTGGGSDYNTNTAVNNPRSTATASFGLVYEGFDYGSFINLSGQTGGTGWTNGWNTDGGRVESGSGDYPDFGAYPPDTPAPTRSGFIDLGNAFEDLSGKRTARRNFPAMTSGRMYIAIKVNDNHSMASGDYLGVELLNGTTTTGFFGKAAGVADRRLSLDYNGTIRTNRIDGSNNGYQINASTDYLLVGMYDFNNHQFRARAYTQNQLAHADPDREAAWIVEMNNVFIDRVDGIRLVASDNNQIVTFDSIRIGPSWEEVMWSLRPNHHIDNGPVPSLVYIGTNYNASFYNQVVTNLSDAELKSSENIDFAVRWDSPLGIFLTNAVATNRNIGSPNARVNPNWDPLAVGAATNEFNLDRFFTNFFGNNGSTVVTTYQFQAFNITNINFENQYFVTVSAENQPGGGTVSAPNGATWDAVPTNRAITINTPLRFYIYDDDTNVPLRVGSGMVALTNASVASSVALGDLRRHFVSDGVLASNGVDLSFQVYDEYSGVQRSAGGPATTNMHVTIDGLVSNDTAHYVASRSSPTTTVATATNVWSFSNTNFTFGKITDLWGGDGSGSQGQDIDVRVTVPDSDDDRVADSAILSNELFGVLRISDDDSDAPTNQFITYGGISLLNRSFYVGTNGFAIGSGDTLIRGTYDRRSGVGENTIFAITDEEMASSGTRGLEFAFGVIDAGSGISRGTSGSTNDVMSFSITNVMSGVITGYNATLSSAANSPNVLQTNVWTFSNGGLSENVITQLMHITGSSGSGAAEVQLTIPDADNDRSNDRSTLYSSRVGYLQVFDDDVAGPSMTLVEVAESSGGDSVLATSFETSQGWPVSALSSTNGWTNSNSYGSWVGVGVTHTSLDPKNSGTRRLGFLTNSFNTAYLELPPVNNPGVLTVYGARVGGGVGGPGLTVDRWDGVQWVGYPTNIVDVTTYTPFTWEIDFGGSNVLLRVRRTDTSGVFRTQVYMDDLSIVTRASWIGTNAMTNAQININWTAAVDDYSGIGSYRMVPPAQGSVPPSGTNAGNSVLAAATSSVQSILGSQGVITGYLFAIDNDNDRSNDNMMGNVASMVIRVDTNPPVPVQNAQTVVDATIDDTTEIKVTWSNHPTAAQAAGWRQSDSQPLSGWDSYIVRYHELDIGSPVTTELTRSSVGWSNVLNNHLFTNMVLSNLNFDARYEISIMGRDQAGNVGPSITVTGITTIFSVTQGFNRVDRDLEIQWIWNEERTYDVVYVDGQSMSDNFTSQWQWVTTITNAGWMTDTGSTSLGRARPTSLSNTLRFYRVSRQGAWAPSNAVRRGSVEVYVTKPLNLYTGENWHSLFFIPDTATVSYVFNTNILPSGATMAESTRISWFEPTAGGSTNQNGSVTAMVWLASSGQWLWQIGGPLNSNADDKLVPLDQGFLIEIPGDPQTNQSPALSMMIIGLVPTQEVVQTISGGTSSSNRIHVLSHNMPVRVPLSSMGFRGSGFVGNNNGVLADEIRILSQGGNGSLQNPKARIRLRSDGVTWQYYNAPGAGAAADPSQFVIDPDDAVIIIRRNASTMYWTNKLWYTPPTKNFTP